MSTVGGFSGELAIQNKIYVEEELVIDRGDGDQNDEDLNIGFFAFQCRAKTGGPC